MLTLTGLQSTKYAENLRFSGGGVLELSDEQLLAKYVDGNPRALEVLLQRKRDWLWSLSLKFLGNPTLAEEAMQEAAITLFKRAHQFKGDAKFTTWMYQIVHNAAIDVVRKNKREVTVEIEDFHEAFAIEAESDAVTEQQSLLRALKQIDPDQRAAVVLVCMEGLSVDEAAGVLGVPAGTVKSRCSRGKSALAELMNESGNQTTHSRVKEEKGR